MAAAVGLSQRHQWRHHNLWRWLMAVATMVPPPMTRTATLVLIALAFALPWTRTGWWGGGHAMMCLIRCPHGCHHWCQLCLHLRDDGTKDNGRGDRLGRHTNFRGQEELGHHNPIGIGTEKQKQKQNKNKINNSGSNVTASAPADSYAHAATAAASAEAKSAAAAARA
jgi:hypothetical protein